MLWLVKSLGQFLHIVNTEEDFMGRVEIDTDYIRIYDSDGEEIVGWVEDEWLEEPTLVVGIATVIDILHTEGEDAVKSMIGRLNR